MSSLLRRAVPYLYGLLGVTAITVLIGLVRSRSAVPDLPTMAIDRVRRHLTRDGTVILHLFTTHLRPVPEAAADEAETA